MQVLPQTVRRPLPQPRPEQKHPGWIITLKGTIAGVSNAIGNRADIPDHWKAAIRAELIAGDVKINFVRLDVHYHPAPDRANLHFTVVRETTV